MLNWLKKMFLFVNFKNIYFHVSSDFFFKFEVWASLVAQMVKNPPAVQETQVPSLGQEDPLEEGMATHSCILAWKIPWTEELGLGSHKE